MATRETASEAVRAALAEAQATITTLKKLLAECQEAENERAADRFYADGRDFTPPYEP